MEVHLGLGKNPGPAPTVTFPCCGTLIINSEKSYKLCDRAGQTRQWFPSNLHLYQALDVTSLGLWGPHSDPSFPGANMSSLKSADRREQDH